MMTEKERLIIAMTQVDNLSKLLEGNPYECFILGELTPIRYELQRQFNLALHGK
jgi:hypothetical protein